MSSFRRAIDAFRITPGGFVNGYAQPQSESSFTIRASVQPLKPNEVESLPEGRRNRKSFRLYTSDTLRVVTESSAGTPGENPDQVELFGERYEVFGEAPWTNNVINHNKYIVQKVLEP